jgi:Flp pilus assembly protein TadG
MFKNVLKRLRSDRGDSNVVSLVIVLPLLVGLLFTIFDISCYFANRAYIQTVAHNGARTISIMGGNGTATTGTPIEKKYGLDRTATCAEVSSAGIAAAAKKTTSTAIECNMMVALQGAAGLVNVSVQSVKCNPSATSSIGQRTSCEIQWKYDGTPGSGMSLLQLGQQNTTAGSSESEVNMGGPTALVPRT